MSDGEISRTNSYEVAAINGAHLSPYVGIKCDTALEEKTVEYQKYINDIRNMPQRRHTYIKKSYCDHVCEALPLVLKNFKL